MTEKKNNTSSSDISSMSSSCLTRGSRNKDIHSTGFPVKRGMTKDLEAGRSMVEMLGVLAIVGVISVGGIAGYTYAMNKHYANELLNGASQRAVILKAQKAAGLDLSLREFDGMKVAGGEFSLDVLEPDGAIGIAVSGVKGAVCENLIKATEGTDIAIAKDDGVLVNDITEEECDDETDNDLVFVFETGLGGAGGNGGDMTAKDCQTRACCDSFGGELIYYNEYIGVTCVLDDEELKCNDIEIAEGEFVPYCVACPVDQVGKCGLYGCACADKEEDIVCDDYKCVVCPDGDAEACLSEGVSCGTWSNPWDCLECPEGEVKHCPENYPSGLCTCAEAEADICDDYGCVVCPDGLIPKCAYNSCYCVESLDYLSCDEDGWCELNCPEGQVEIRPDGWGGYGMCGVVQEECPAGQVRKCAEQGDPAYGGCACADKEEQIFCDSDMCIACPEGQIGYCLEYLGSCYCTDKTDENKYCNGLNCIVCPEGEIGQCAPQGPLANILCACGADVDCGEYACIGCPEGKTAHCPPWGSGCICADENDDVYCEEECIIVPPGHKADCGGEEGKCITCPAGQAPVCDDDANTCECQTCQTGEQVSCITDEDGNQVCRCCPNGTTLVFDEYAWAHVCR